MIKVKVGFNFALMGWQWKAYRDSGKNPTSGIAGHPVCVGSSLFRYKYAAVDSALKFVRSMAGEGCRDIKFINRPAAKAEIEAAKSYKKGKNNYKRITITGETGFGFEVVKG